MSYLFYRNKFRIFKYKIKRNGNFNSSNTSNYNPN